jgi:hypothetical protein
MIYSDVTTVTTSPVQLGRDKKVSKIVVSTPHENTASVFIGDYAVTIDKGVELEPGEFLTLEVYTVSEVFVVAEAGTQKIKFLAMSNKDEK